MKEREYDWGLCADYCTHSFPPSPQTTSTFKESSSMEAVYISGYIGIMENKMETTIGH